MYQKKPIFTVIVLGLALVGILWLRMQLSQRAAQMAEIEKSGEPRAERTVTIERSADGK